MSAKFVFDTFCASFAKTSVVVNSINISYNLAIKQSPELYIRVGILY